MTYREETLYIARCRTGARGRDEFPLSTPVRRADPLDGKDGTVISVPVGGQPREFKCQKAHDRLCRCNHKAGAWKMHANLTDLTITASDHDIMDVRGDQFTNNRVASGIVRRDGNGLARFPTVGILRIDGRAGDRRGIPCYIERLLRTHLASAAVADGRNALSPSLEPRKAVERRRRRSEILSQVPNRMIGGEVGEADGRALQERALVSQRLIQPIEMCAQLIKAVGHRRQHHSGIDISTGELDPVFEKPLRQHFRSLRERDADSREEGCLLGPPGKRVGCAAAGGVKGRSWGTCARVHA